MFRPKIIFCQPWDLLKIKLLWLWLKHVKPDIVYHILRECSLSLITVAPGLSLHINSVLPSEYGISSIMVLPYLKTLALIIRIWCKHLILLPLRGGPFLRTVFLICTMCKFGLTHPPITQFAHNFKLCTLYTVCAYFNMHLFLDQSFFSRQYSILFNIGEINQK